MTYYTVTFRLAAALERAVAVEWTNQAAPLDSGQGWEPCLRLDDGTWRFSSSDPADAAAPHRRAPGTFPDLAIRYRLEPAGPWSAAAAERRDVEIVADAAATPRWVLPVGLTPPGLLGAGEVGSELAVDPGLWGGAPAPALAFQWRRDGVDLPGATARAYATGAADDGCAITCSVTAANLAGFAAATAGPRRVTYAAPRLVGALDEEVFDQGTGAQRVETAHVFAGGNLAFAASGGAGAAGMAAGVAIDPATGVLSVPTDLAVDGATILVAASNSGGRAEARLSYTVEAAPERRLEAADVTVLRSVWRPEGQEVTFSPELAFPGLVATATTAIEFTADPLGAAAPAWRAVRADAAGVWRLQDDAAAGGVDRALLRAGDARAERLRFRWRMAEAQDWSAESVAVTAPPPAPRLAAAFMPSQAETQAAMDHILRGYKVDVEFGSDNEGTAIQNVFPHCPVPLLALATFAGEARAFTTETSAFRGSRIPRARLLEHMRHWLDGRAPAGRSGYNAQYEAQFVAVAAIMRATPAVWDLAPALGGLSAAEKTQIDLVMKGCAIGSLWVVSDQNPYGMGVLSGRQRTVRGYKAQRGSVPNYSSPPRLIPFVVDGYMRLNGTTLQAWLTGFDRDAFAAEVQAAGRLTDLWNTYRQTWTLEVMRAAHPGMIESFGPGPDKAMLHAALRDGFADGRYRTFGMTLDQSQDMFMGEFERFFSKVVRPGPSTYGANIPLPGREPGPGWATAHGLKTSSPLSGIDDTQLRGVLGSANPDGTTNKAAWAGLPNPGAIGMMYELDDVDGGGGGNPPIRACTTYAYHGASALANLTAAAAVLGRLDRSDARFAAADGTAGRMRVGVTDFLYRTDNGHREYSKGAQDHPNRDWNLAYIEDQGARFETWKGMWRMIDAWSRI